MMFWFAIAGILAALVGFHFYATAVFIGVLAVVVLVRVEAR